MQPTEDGVGDLRRDDHLDPATLFNFSTLSLFIPPSSSSLISQAPPASCSSSSTTNQHLTNSWISSLCSQEEREHCYLDENLQFYLLMKLPLVESNKLNRAQVLNYLLPNSTTSIPHLLLTVDGSFVEGATSSSIDNSSTPDPDPAQEDEPVFDLSKGLGIGKPPSTSGTISSYSTASDHKPKVPLTPSPLPLMRKKDLSYNTQASDGEQVHLWSLTFENRQPVGEQGDYESTKKKKNYGNRCWIGREVTEGKEGSWIAVWEFNAQVDFVKSRLRSPRLCLTLNVAFRDDPKLAETMRKFGNQNSEFANGDLGYNEDDDEYLVESFEDVNLLEGLSSIFPNTNGAPLHLPASRLPQSFEPTPPSNTPRRPSRAMALALDSATPGLTDGLLHPTIRRAVRRILTVRSPIVVRMKAIPCPIATNLSTKPTTSTDPRPRFGGGGGISINDDSSDNRGLVMCVEVEGSGGRSHDPSEEAKTEGFEIESVEIEVAGAPGSTTSISSAGRGEVEIKPIGQEDRIFPVVVQANEQYNFLYAVTIAPDAAQDIDVGFVRSQPSQALPAPIPLVVATSPSQRFQARFGEEMNELGVERIREMETREAIQASTSPLLRNVTIVVRGRPIKVISSSTNNAQGGYVVNGEQSTSSSTEGEHTAPSGSSFASRWNTTLDVSSFAFRAPPKRTTFEQRDRSNPFALSAAVAAATARAARHPSPFEADSTRPRSINRNSATPSNDFETIAGSKRHTMASLAALAAKSPVLSRAHVATLSDSPRTSMSTSRALPPVPTNDFSATAKRYFSLPSVGSPNPSAPASRPKSPFNPVRSSTPPSNWRSSLPLGGHNQHPQQHHESPNRWSNQPRNSHDGIRRAVDEYHDTLIDHGQILVSITLMPLRAVKKPISITPNEEDEQESSISEKLTSDNGSSPHASFRFPSPVIPSFSTSPKPDEESSTEEVNGPKYRAPKVGLLDVFLVEVFVVNRSDRVKRFTVGVPTGSEEELRPVASITGAGRSKIKVASLVALENDVRIGPLAPRSCASVTLRFLAIRPGAHPLTELRLVDLATGLETRLNNPLSVVVEA